MADYPELGTVDQKKMLYPEGAEITHPSGAVYKRINGNWQCIRLPAQAPAQET